MLMNTEIKSSKTMLINKWFHKINFAIFSLKINISSLLLYYSTLVEKLLLSNALITLKSSIKKKTHKSEPIIWQRVIFTGAGPAIVTVQVLNFCVRDGYRCVHLAVATRSLRSFPQNRITADLIFLLWLSPRPISISQLRISLCFHPWPIYLIVFQGSYYLRMGNLILEAASCLDAFSAYPFPS